MFKREEAEMSYKPSEPESTLLIAKDPKQKYTLNKTERCISSCRHRRIAYQLYSLSLCLAFVIVWLAATAAVVVNSMIRSFAYFWVNSFVLVSEGRKYTPDDLQSPHDNDIIGMLMLSVFALGMFFLYNYLNESKTAPDNGKK